jgi:choline-sulfatase
MPGNLGNPNGPLNYNVLTLAHRMANAGYSTVYHGKSHLGTDLGQLGFKTCFENSHDPSTVTEACRYWRNRDWVIQKRPFFQVVSLMNPHDIYFLDPAEERPVSLPPWENRHDTRQDKPWPQQEYARGQGWSDERWEYYRQFYASRVETLDRDLATLLEELVMGGFGSNTWVLFMADHGDMAGEHGVGFKGPFMYDAQIPFIIMPPREGYPGPWREAPPEGFRPHACDALCSHIDVVPTVLDIAGIEPDPALRGRSLLPAVRGEATEGHEAVFAELTMLGRRVAPVRMVRTRRWKYNFYLGHGEELYDLENDPIELRNLAGRAEHAKVQADLKARLLRFIAETGDPIFSQQPTDGAGRPFTTAPVEIPDGFAPGARTAERGAAR